MKSRNISATNCLILPKFITYTYATEPNVMETSNEDDLSWEIGISQQPLVRSYPNLKFSLRGPGQILWKLNMKTTSWKKTSKMKSSNISATTGRKFETNAKGTRPNVIKTENEDDLLWKTASKKKCRSVSATSSLNLSKFET